MLLRFVINYLHCMWLIVGYNYHYVCVVKLLDERMGRRNRPLPLVAVGQGLSHSQQRVEAKVKEAHISEEVRPIASDDETQPPGS